MAHDREWRWILRRTTKPRKLDDGAISLAHSKIIAMAPVIHGAEGRDKEFEELQFEVHLAASLFAERRRYETRKLRNGQPESVKRREEHPPLIAYALEVMETLEAIETQRWRIARQQVDVDIDRLSSWLTLVNTAAQIQGMEFRLKQARSDLRQRTLAAVDAGVPITIAAKSAHRSREWVYKEMERARTRATRSS